MRRLPAGVCVAVAAAVFALCRLQAGAGPVDRAARLHPRKAVPVLTFHDLSVHFDKGSIFTPVKRFEQMVAWLKKHKYQTFFASEIPDLLAGNSRRLAPGCKPVVLTFDDGYRNNHTLLFPLLKKHGIRITLFLVVGKVVDERPPGYRRSVLTWAEVSEMIRSGLVEVGSHTYNLHCHLVQAMGLSGDARLFRQRLWQDLCLSRRILKTKLGVDSRCLAWPHGKRTGEMVWLARNAGFTLIFNTQFRTNVPGECALTDLYRLNASSPFMTVGSLGRRLALAENQAAYRLKIRLARRMRRQGKTFVWPRRAARPAVH